MANMGLEIVTQGNGTKGGYRGKYEGKYGCMQVSLGKVVDHTEGDT